MVGHVVAGETATKSLSSSVVRSRIQEPLERMSAADQYRQKTVVQGLKNCSLFKYRLGSLDESLVN
jgi:hypothetical protein